ncbi:TetR family transcriptional regulator [Actinopolymorpha pittospori]
MARKQAPEKAEATRPEGGDPGSRRRTPAAADRRRDPERTQERILDAGLAEFSAKGYAGARVNEIAERAGVNKQLISYYFGGKAGLHRALLARWRQGEDEVVAGQRERTLPDLVTGYVARLPRDRDLARLLAWEGLTTADGTGTSRSGEEPEGADDDADDPSGQVRTSRMQEALVDLDRRQHDGEIADDLDPRAFLLAIMAATTAPVTLPHLARSIYGTDPDSDEFAAAYAEQLARMVRHLAGPKN